MPEENTKKKLISQIVVAVVVALLVGGTSPWWWHEIFSKNIIPQPPPNNSSNRNNISPVNPIFDKKIIVTATTNPPVISKSQKTTLTVFVQDSQGRPLQSAIVTLSAGGGRFDKTRTSTVSGQTDPSGVFRAYWSCDYCAPVYIGGVQITKPGYEEARSQWRIEIR